MIARLNMGGPAQHFAVLSGRRFDPSRYETLLVHGALAPGEHSMADFAEREGAQMTHLPDLVQPVSLTRDPRALRKLIRLARQFRPHIVHTHTAKAGVLGRVAALFVRPRPLIVHTYHGHVLEGYFSRSKTIVYRGLERGLARVSDCLIGVSQSTVDDLVRLRIAPRDKFRAISLGLDLDRFGDLNESDRVELRRELGVEDGEVLLTYVGRVVPIKRVDLLLTALKTACEQGSPVRLAIVGDGELRPDLERLAGDLGIVDAVRFLGYRRDLTRIAAAIDIAVLSSDNEGTPVSLIEAAAAARPAVATSVGGVPEVVGGDSGILVPRGDPRALAEAIERLASDSELRAQMGRRGRERVLRRYSLERLLADMDRLYSELASGPRGTSAG